MAGEATESNMAEQQGMFGPSAEELQRALMERQQAADFERARQFGMMNLGQQIGATAYGGGLGISRGIEGLGRAFGVLPEDPRIRQAQKMEEIKQGLMQAGVDPRNIDEFYPEMITQLQQAGMMDKAFELEKQYQTLATQREATQARMGKIRDLTLDQQMPGRVVYRRLAGMPDKFDAAIVEKFGQSITPSNPRGDQGLLKDAAIAKEGKFTKIGEDDKTGRAVFGDPLGKEPPFYFDENGVKVPAGKIREGKAPTAIAYGGSTGPLKTFDVVQNLRSDFLKETQDLRETLNAASQAGDLLTQARGGNQVAASALRQTMGKIFKADAQVSKAEIAAIASSTAIPRRLLDYVTSLSIGRPSELTLEEMAQLIDAMNRVAYIRRQKTQDKWKKQATRRGVEGPDVEFITDIEEGSTPPTPLSTAGRTQLTPYQQQLIDRYLPKQGNQ